MSIQIINEILNELCYKTEVSGTICKIKNSHTTPQKKIAGLLNALKYCPIFSENRINAEIKFTVVPYAMGERFLNIPCKRVQISAEILWRSVESIPTLFKPDEPLILQGSLLSPTAKEAYKKEVLSCNTADETIIDFCANAPNEGTLADLGCGSGINSIPFLEKNWKVVAIDSASEVLEKYRLKVAIINKTLLTNGSLQLIHTDVSTYAFDPNRFDVVLCTDLLPYIRPKQIQSLLQKIYVSLKVNGRLFGTLLFDDPNQAVIVEYMSKLGAHFYPNESFASSMLEHSGFRVDQCRLRLSIESEQSCVAQFIATKI